MKNPKKLFDKKITCLNCHTYFETKKPILSRLRIIDSETDGHKIYKENSPNLYEINVCPICGFAFDDRLNNPLYEENIKKLLSYFQTVKNFEQYCQERSIQDAIRIAERHLAHLRLSPGVLTVTVVALIVSLTTVILWPIMRSDLHNAVWPGKLKEPRYSFDAAELAMMTRLRVEIPPEQLVTGDPASGMAFLPAVSDVKVSSYYMGWSFSDPDGEYLARHFSDIRTDPQVCEIVRRHRIHYFYADQDTRFNGAPNSRLRPGFYGVDLSEGFTLIDSGGSAAVYRIDLCWTPDGEPRGE